MFSLIIAIASIALVVVLSIATVYYLGNDLDGGQKAKIDVATYINHSQQIKGAVNMYVAEHNGMLPADTNTLITDGYLKALPDPNWQIAGNYLTNSNITQSQCQKYNDMLIGDPTVPSCSTPNLPENICCQA